MMKKLFFILLLLPFSAFAESGNVLTSIGQLGNTGSCLFPQGTVSKPSVAFGDGDTGLYEISDDTLVFSINGTGWYYYNTASIYSSTGGGFQINRTDATSTNPSYSFNNDGNTGIGTNGIGEVSIINSGVEQLRTTTTETRFMGGININLTDVNAATYDLLPTDSLLFVSYTGTAAVTSLTLPTAQCDGAEDNGRLITIKDSGNANTNNITVDTEGAETIDGAGSLTINTDYASVDLFCYSSNWYIK